MSDSFRPATTLAWHRFRTAHLPLQHDDVKEAELAFEEEMKVGVEEDSFNVTFFSVWRFCSVRCHCLGFGIKVCHFKSRLTLMEGLLDVALIYCVTLRF
jgi:hypothetical protein